ncbi:MarR family winged helix-turn-helix transcriptional regulator [Solicola sp. PLA-1-18]|uniref:MarR family winged helix-turn-helix transcriptional regulator n=1 Tax=Solicola sp. PLA-1-18 TaxID=3380532 RepID=UPI003B8059B5
MEPDPRYAVMILLREVTTSTDRFVERRGTARGLHRTHLHALAHVIDASRAGTTMTPGRLASALNLSAPATTALVDRLEAAGHVTRAPSADDRRRVHVAATPTALAMGQELFAPLGQTMMQVVEQFSDDEIDVVARFLRASVEAIDAATEA